MLTEIGSSRISYNILDFSFKQIARQAGASALVGVATIITLDEKDV